MQQQFIIVIDGETSMARMVNSSVSSRVCSSDEKWMGYYVHLLQNCVKSDFYLCADDACLWGIELDFKSVKRVSEDSRRYGSSKDLPVGYRLIQDVDTKFGILFLAIERFLKPSSKVWDIILTQSREIAGNSFESLETETIDVAGSSYPRYLCLEAIVDAFRAV